MVQLYTGTGRRVGLLADCKGLHVKHALAYDEKTLFFKYPANGPFAQDLKNEAYIRTQRDEFVIKKVGGGTSSAWIDITAEMNIEGIENCLFVGGFEAVEATIVEVLNLALKDSGWSIGSCYLQKRRTIRKQDDCDAWDVIKQCVSTYRCEIEVDTLKHLINIYEARGHDRGLHFMEGVNLRSLDYDRDTYEFYTQILPVGKDGLTLMGDADHPVDRPVLVLENYTYSGKKIRKVWRDERYTNIEHLREDAQAKLDEACRPLSSYTGSVRDLSAGRADGHRDFFRYSIGDTIRLISKTTGIQERQRIVEIDEYENDQDNRVEIANVARSYAQMQQDAQEESASAATRLAAGYTDKQLEGCATSEEVQEVKTSTSEELKGYAKKQDVTTATAHAESLIQATEDRTAAKLKNYWTAQETRAKIGEAANALSSDLEGLHTKVDTVESTAAQALAAAQRITTGTAETSPAAPDAAGTARVELPPGFAAAAGYDVFLQAAAAAALYVSESDTKGFVVAGPGGVRFTWLAVAKAKTT